MPLKGIRDTKTVSMMSTLAENGLDSLKVTEIKQLLENDCKIMMEAAEISNLTFQKLLEIDQNSKFKKMKRVIMR